jgi:hypothetical protein
MTRSAQWRSAIASQPIIVYQALILSVLLACVVAWIIAHRYRRRMQQLMRAPLAGKSTAPATDAAAVSPPSPAQFSLADNRAAGMRLSTLLIALSCLIAVTSACVWCVLMFPGDRLFPKRVAVVALLHLWPVIPALALMWRWPRKRLFGALLLWCAAIFVVLLVKLSPLGALKVMASEMGLSLVLASLVFLGNATRAVAPWLLMPAALLMWASLTSIDMFFYMFQQQSPLLISSLKLLEGLLGGSWYVSSALLVLVALGSWVFAWWPVRVLGRALGRAYSRKWLSDLLVVFTGVWAFALTDRALTVANQRAGAGAFAMYLPLLWIPAGMGLAARWRARRGRPPTLLVLRVFHQDALARSLFDHVAERWRLSGNTVLIAGTDLADRTLDADDIFRFLDRKLAQRFIASPADIPRRIAEFDMTADIDGRYRVNECYCHDTMWQDALQALVRFSDVVLMDLRGFQAHNAGCRYELAALAGASHELRVVVLIDDRDRSRRRRSGGRLGPTGALHLDRSFALQRQQTSRSPGAAVRLKELDNERYRYLDASEETALMAALVSRRAHLHSMVIIALGIGLRKREQLNLRRDQIEFFRNVMIASRTKGKRNREIPMDVLDEHVKPILMSLCGTEEG